jgi:hypothetical protein
VLNHFPDLVSHFAIVLIHFAKSSAVVKIPSVVLKNDYHRARGSVERNVGGRWLG